MERYIQRYVGSAKNNFVYVQDQNQIFAVGVTTDTYLRNHGVECTPYVTRWTPGFIEQIVRHVDSLHQ